MAEKARTCSTEIFASSFCFRRNPFYLKAAMHICLPREEQPECKNSTFVAKAKWKAWTIYNCQKTGKIRLFSIEETEKSWITSTDWSWPSHAAYGIREYKLELTGPIEKIRPVSPISAKKQKAFFFISVANIWKSVLVPLGLYVFRLRNTCIYLNFSPG